MKTKLAVTVLAVAVVLVAAALGRHDAAVAAVTVWHGYFTTVRAMWTWTVAVL